MRLNKRAFYTVPELAGITRESAAMWRKRIYRRELDYVKNGRNVRVPESALNAWISSRTVRSERRGA